MGIEFNPIGFWSKFCSEEPEHEDKLWFVDRENAENPLSKFVGNDAVVKKLQVVAFNAFGKIDHNCAGINFAVFGLPSTGKTTLVKMFARLVDIPYCEISPKSISNLSNLKDVVLSSISSHISESHQMVGLKETDSNVSTFPPCIVFIDEVHALSDYLVNGVLKATEHDDATLVTESGEVFDCKNVCWFIGTTEEGKLFDAFRSRFSPLHLVYLTKKEISKIIKISHDDLSENVCDSIAFYNSRLPRKALEFARYLKLKRNMDIDKSFDELCLEIAKEDGVDEHGMHKTHLEILKAIKDQPVAKNRLASIVDKKIDELENYIMPVLLSSTKDQGNLVRVTNKGYGITADGLLELKKRGISYEHRSDT